MRILSLGWGIHSYRILWMGSKWYRVESWTIFPLFFKGVMGFSIGPFLFTRK